MEIFQKKDPHTLEVQGQTAKVYSVKQLKEMKQQIKERKQYAIAKFEAELAAVDALLSQCAALKIAENPDEKTGEKSRIHIRW